jgi:hypothetical protein
MAGKKFSRDDLEIASGEELDQIAFGEVEKGRKYSGNNSRSVSRK